MKTPLRAFGLTAMTLTAGLLVTPIAYAQDETKPAVTIELLDAGASPQRELRFAPEVGSTQTVVTKNEMSQTMSMNGMEMPGMDMPASSTTTVFTVADVAESGNITYTFEFTDAQVIGGGNPMVAQQMEMAMKGMVGKKGTAVISDRGEQISVAFQGGDDNPMVQEQLKSVQQNLSQMSMPFPEQPVGVGARWTATQQINLVVEATQVTTFEVVSINGDDIELNMTLVQTAEPGQAFSAPGMPPGAAATVNEFKSNAQGTATVNMTMVAPVKSDSKSTMEMSIEMEMQGQTMSMDQKVDVHMTMKQKEDAD